MKVHFLTVLDQVEKIIENTEVVIDLCDFVLVIFFITQILRETKVGDFRSSKTAILKNFRL